MIGLLLGAVLVVIVCCFTNCFRFAKGVQEETRIRDSTMKANGLTDTSKYLPYEIYKKTVLDSIKKAP